MLSALLECAIDCKDALLTMQVLRGIKQPRLWDNSIHRFSRKSKTDISLVVFWSLAGYIMKIERKKIYGVGISIIIVGALVYFVGIPAVQTHFHYASGYPVNESKYVRLIIDDFKGRQHWIRQ